MDKTSAKKMSTLWEKKKSRKILIFQKIIFLPLFLIPECFAKKKKKEKARSFVEKYSNRLEDYGHCANSQITPGLPVENW